MSIICCSLQINCSPKGDYALPLSVKKGYCKAIAVIRLVRQSQIVQSVIVALAR